MSDDVAVRLPDGTAGTVPASQVSQLPEGSKPMSAAEVAAEKKAIALDKKYEFRSGNIGQAATGLAAATVAGGARGATLGLSDYLASEFGGREYLNEVKEAFPVASGVGEAGGMLGLAAATGGAGAAAEGAAAARLGGYVLARGAAATARSAVEMGIYEAGRSVGDQALDGKPIDFEKVAAQGMHGVAIGTGFGVAGGLLGAGVAKLASGRGAAAVEKAVAGEAGAVERAAAPKGSLREALATKAQETSDELFGQALGATKGQIKTINRNVEGGAERVFRDVRGELRTELGASLPADRKALMEGVESAIERRAEERATMLAKADEAGTALAPTADNAIKAIEEKFITSNMVARTVEASPIKSRLLGGLGDGAVMGNDAVQLSVKFGKEAEVKAAQDVIERLRNGFGDAPTFKDWARSITDLGKEAKFDKLTAPLAAEVKQSVYGIMSEELGRAMDVAAPNLGASLAAEYRANGKVMQSLIKSRELLETGIAGNTSNNAFGLTSRIAGIAGGAVGGLSGGIVSAGVGKLVQDRGAMLASDLLERAAGALGARRIAARTEAQVARGVAQLTGTAPAETFGLGSAPFRAPAIVASRLSQKDFASVRKSVERAASDPNVIVDAVQAQVGGSQPKIRQGVTETMSRGVQYLATKLPPSKADPYALQPQFDDKDRMSDAEKSAFLRSAEAVANPTMVLEEAKKGTLTRDHVEAVKAVYPALYEEMRVQVMQSLIDGKQKLSYSRRIQLGILLDIPTDKTLSPDFVSAIQGTYAQGAGDAESPPPPPARPLNVAGSVQTATQSAVESAE